MRGTKLDPDDGLPPPNPMFNEIWPLHLLDVADEDQRLLLLKLLSRLPQLIEHYLSSYIFPQTMLHQTVKLSANAQELGGDLLFKTRLGFSGTPSDLLPLELGHCHYAQGDDAKVLQILTSTDHCAYTALPFDWSVDSLLAEIANASPAFHALIDTGALVTGLTNLQVAQELLQRGLPDVDAVIFLDELDRKMALLRNGFKVVELAECGVALERRFSFYDCAHHRHDIQQLMNAHAALTLGKDMVFRDYAQGAFRMRQTATAAYPLHHPRGRPAHLGARGQADRRADVASGRDVQRAASPPEASRDAQERCRVAARQLDRVRANAVQAALRAEPRGRVA